jgi:guanylate kinase
LIVLSSPSGGGKTTVAEILLRRDRRLVRAVTCTTRRPRKGERNGRDYFFLTPARFRAMARRGAFLEWARVHGNLYGTPRSWTLGQIRKGRDVLLVIDVQGGRIVGRKAPDAVRIFLAPPSMAVLRRRLKGRGSESARDLAVRLRNARREMREGARYDHRVVNDRLSDAVRDVREILRKVR